MAKLTRLIHTIYDVGGSRKIATMIDLPIKVDTKGRFACKTEDPQVIAYADQSLPDISAYRQGVFYSHNLEDLKSLVIRTYKEAYCTTSKEELVIRYTVKAKMSFVRDGADYRPNACSPQNPNDWEWEKHPFFGDIHAGSNREAYSISLGAYILTRVTVYRANGTSYYTYTSAEDTLLGHWGKELESWCGLRRHMAEVDETEQEIPYSEEAAKFFHLSMLSLVKLADSMFQFFNKPQNELLAIIKTGTQRVLTNKGNADV